jgi:hypothetical protein
MIPSLLRTVRLWLTLLLLAVVAVGILALPVIPFLVWMKK